MITAGYRDPVDGGSVSFLDEGLGIDMKPGCGWKSHNGIG